MIRNGFVYYEIPFEEIRQISITEGAKVKRPFLVVLFGLILILGAIILLLLTSGFNNITIYEDRFEPSRFYGLIVILTGFLIFFGGFAVFQALKPVKILKIFYADSKDTFPLDNINEAELASFLKERIPNKFNI